MIATLKPNLMRQASRKVRVSDIMKFAYCPVCGKKLIEKIIGDEGNVPFCEACQRPHFNFSYPCIIALVVNEYFNEIALIRQNYVSTENYVCVAGFIKQGETVEYTAKREVEEELGLEVINVRYIKSYYYGKRDNLMLGTVCIVKKKTFDISSELDSAIWCEIEEAKSLLRQGSIGMNLLEDYLQAKQL